MSLRTDEEIIQRLLDGKASAREFEAFEQRLRVEPSLRRLYLSYNRSHLLLGEKFAHSEPALARGPRSTPARWWKPLAVAAAVALVAGLALWREGVAPVAKVEFGPESHGRVVGSRKEGVLEPGARVELDHGSVALQLSAGRAYLEGPGALVCVEENSFQLLEGRLWLETPPGSKRAFRCTTQHLSVDSKGGEFGLLVDRLGQEEIQVIGGRVEVASKSGGAKAPQLVAAGELLRWTDGDLRHAEEALAFSAQFPEVITLFADDFDDPDYTPLAKKEPDIGGGRWEVLQGGPTILGGVLDTSGNTRHVAFAPLDKLPLDDLSNVLLVTIETVDPGTHGFHTEGWAGVSLFTGNEERIFVGDPCGPEKGWALHPVGYEARHSCPLLEGRHTVTLRYDFRTGLTQLFDGTDTSGPARASEWISPGLSFDRIRIANGSQTDAAADAGKDRSSAGDGPGVNVRSDIALKRLSVKVLRAQDERHGPKS